MAEDADQSIGTEGVQVAITSGAGFVLELDQAMIARFRVNESIEFLSARSYPGVGVGMDGSDILAGELRQAD